MKRIDQLDKKILNLIKDNARIPYLEIARVCNVSGAAIHQRINKLQAMGIIKGSRILVDTHIVGIRTCAYVGITLEHQNSPESIIESLKEILEITECHFSTGRYAILVKVYAKDNEHLLEIIQKKILPIQGIGTTESLISLTESFNRQINFDNLF